MTESLKKFICNLSLTQVVWLLILASGTAFLLNLNAVPFIGDEGIRTLVAFEMTTSGNYIVPTQFGEPYFNKPPLYNWFIIVSSTLFGGYGEWPSRMTTLVFLGLFAWSAYHFTRLKTDRITAITMAFMLLTSGRILFWDSMLALIDICFSWIIYVNFMVLYFYGKEGRWQRMFLLSYLLFSVAFLLKGFPALVFQGISMLVALYFHKALKSKLFSAAHWIGIGIGVIPLVVYYLLYASHVSMEQVVSILFEQSIQRTPVRFTIWETVVHFFAFPFEQIYHFLPWSLLVLVGLHPRVRAWIREDAFMRFNFWMLMANLPVYWVSVEVYPRYLLMFIPLFNIITYLGVQQLNTIRPRYWNIIRWLFLVITLCSLVSITFMRFVPLVRDLPFLNAVWICGTIAMAFGLAGIVYDKTRLFLWFVFAVLVTRSVFNMVVLPIRAAEHDKTPPKIECQRIGEKYADETLYLYKHSNLNEVTRAYASIYTNQIIHRASEATDTSALYLVQKDIYPDIQGIRVDSMVGVGGRVFVLMRSPEENPAE